MTFTATAPDRSNDPRVLGAAAITVLLWASAFIMIRGAGEHFGPGGMALLRMLVGSAALSVVVLIRHRTRGVAWPSLRSLPAVVVWGVAWFGVYNVALNAAEQSIDAGTAAMLVNVAPLIVVVLAGFLLGEGFPRQLMLGVPVAFGGVVLIGVSTSTGQNSVVGVLLALAAAVLYGGSALAQKHLLRRVDPVVLTWVGALAGTVALLPWAGSLGAELGGAPVTAVWAVIYLGVFPTAIAFLTWAFVLGRSSAGRTAATTYVVPALAVLMGWLLLGEVPTPLALVGGALCLAGVFITRLRPRRPAGGDPSSSAAADRPAAAGAASGDRTRPGRP